MIGIDFKQIPNLEQVYVIALVPLLFVAIVSLGLIFALWMQTRLIQRRLDLLQAELKAVLGRTEPSAIDARR